MTRRPGQSEGGTVKYLRVLRFDGSRQSRWSTIMGELNAVTNQGTETRITVLRDRQKIPWSRIDS